MERSKQKYMNHIWKLIPFLRHVKYEEGKMKPNQIGNKSILEVSKSNKTKSDLGKYECNHLAFGVGEN
jgi:hypothetical protein